MNIAIISDIHDNLINLEKCLAWCAENKIAEIICCGDMTNSETLNLFGKKFKNQIHLVEGNIELYTKEELKKFKHIHYYGKAGRFKIADKNIGICHAPYFINEIPQADNCDLIFYGHTHRPWLENTGGIKKINPGELGGMWGKATFAVWNTESDAIELKLLEWLYKIK